MYRIRVKNYREPDWCISFCGGSAKYAAGLTHGNNVVGPIGRQIGKCPTRASGVVDILIIGRRMVHQVALDSNLLVFWYTEVVRESSSRKSFLFARALRLGHGGIRVD
jgi:hypothetical protein